MFFIPTMHFVIERNKQRFLAYIYDVASNQPIISMNSENVNPPQTWFSDGSVISAFAKSKRSTKRVEVDHDKIEFVT